MDRSADPVCRYQVGHDLAARFSAQSLERRFLCRPVDRERVLLTEIRNVTAIEQTQDLRILLELPELLKKLGAGAAKGGRDVLDDDG